MNTVGRAPQQHPSEATLLAHASGGLGAAHRLVVATHTMQCADCHSKIRTAERVGGLLLDGLVPTALQPDALQLCLAQTEVAEAPSRGRRPARPTVAESRRLPPRVGGVILPQVLWGLRPGRLRWLAPGIRHATLLRDERGTLHFIRVHPNVALPQHTHRGLELTCVLEGAFHDGSGQYLVGDVGEVGDEETERHGIDHDHLVVADPPRDCVCIMATSGRLRFTGWIARLLQPVMPF